MMDFAAFANGISQSDATPKGLIASNDFISLQRFNVYRNNVAVSLVEALCTNYPVCRQIVGDDFFRAMARIYVASNKPSSPIMHLYGRDFCNFIDCFQPASCTPYLADVARLEAARVSAYHAQDYLPLLSADFAALDPERLANLRITLHPAARIVRSNFAIVSVWGAHQGAQSVENIDPFTAEDALVTRPNLHVETSLLPPGGAELLESLARGGVLAEAAAQSCLSSSEFNLAQVLNVLISTGAACLFTYDDGD
ncbi:MAG: DNA-binding domain-containing protein [Beijerinckiaceae bacterium]|nr:DNA-binding domain-containing protein [Beijerinckiaceae bacterium]